MNEIKEGIDSIQRRIQSLHDKYQSIQKEIKKLEKQREYFSYGHKESVMGTIVWKLGRCSKSGCIPCRTTNKNTHGPYPHLQWRNEDNRIETKYLSKEKFRDYYIKINISQQLNELEELLIKQEKKKQKIEQTINDLLYKLG
jgi:chromosome segregation ATPase